MKMKYKANINGAWQTVERELTEQEIAEMQNVPAEEIAEEPTQLDRIEAQVMYTALLTDTLIESEVE